MEMECSASIYQEIVQAHVVSCIRHKTCTSLGAAATILWFISMTRKDCIGLVVSSIVVSGWSFSLFGLRTPWAPLI